MDREKFGLKGFDNMVQGGLPKNAIVGLSGPPGVGKSIFSLHYLLQGAKEGKKSLYISLEEPIENIQRMINSFSFSDEFKKYMKNGKIVIRSFSYEEYEQLYDDLFTKIKSDKAIQRVVIDSFNGFFLAVNPDEKPSEINIRKKIAKTFQDLRESKVTSLLLLEKANNTLFNVPYLVDGMINLDYLELDAIERRIFVPKMRWTSQFKESLPFEIKKKGIHVHSE